MCYCYQLRGAPRVLCWAPVSWSQCTQFGNSCMIHCYKRDASCVYSATPPRSKHYVCAACNNWLTSPKSKLRFPVGELSSRIYHCRIISHTHANVHSVLVKCIHSSKWKCVHTAVATYQCTRVHKNVMSSKTHKNIVILCWETAQIPVKTCFLCIIQLATLLPQHGALGRE